MKKIIFLVLLMVSTTIFAQEIEKSTAVNENSKNSKTIVLDRKNELKLDVIYLIFHPALNLSYERLLTTESGLGATLVFSSEDESRISNTTFSFTPYFRYYFGKKPSSGFFFEGFTALNTFRYQRTNIYTTFGNNGSFNLTYENIDEKITDLALGIGLGGKWITNNGIVFELNTGVGRNLLNKYANNNGFDAAYKIFVRGGISIGYRF